MNSAISRHIRSTELRRQDLQTTIDATKPAGERNRLGQFATPYALAVDIARYVALLIGAARGIRFADPAVGTGSFFSAALAIFGPERIRSAVGVEIDATSANTARALWADSGLEVVDGDFTRIVAASSRPSAPNLILANPPYVRHHHISREDKERLGRLALGMAGVDISGLAGLYVYFLLLATAWMEENGIAAWLVPSEFMDVNYGMALKRFLTDRVTLIRVHRFDPTSVQFDDALVSSVVLVFRKERPPANHAIEFSFGGNLAHPHSCSLVSRERLCGSRKWTSYPEHSGNDRRTLDHGNGPTLGDLFRVQRGIATGCNKFFILERLQAEKRGFPKPFLRPVLPGPRFLKTTVIDSAEDGYPLGEPQLCVIDCNIPETVLRVRHPALWDYLQTAAAIGIRDGYLVGKRSPWYRQEQRLPAPFLCTYMGRGSGDQRPFRFIWNRSQAIATNLYLMLYPQNGLASMLRDHPERAADVFALLGDISGYELRGEGRVYGGGLNKIEPRELARVSAVALVERWPELRSTVLRQGSLCDDLSNMAGSDHS